MDNVLIRLIESRIYYKNGENKLIKENCYREIDWKKCQTHHFAASNIPKVKNILYNPDLLTQVLLEDAEFCKRLNIDKKETFILEW